MDVVIPNYSGLYLLETYLPTVLNALDTNHRVYVVDDASEDGSVDMLKSRYPEVVVVEREHRGGFGAAANDGIQAGSGELVALLNNDIQLTDGFVGIAQTLIENPDIFAVTPRMLTPDEQGVDDGAKIARWHHGMLYVDLDTNNRESRTVFFTSGGACIYRRSMLEQLGGFDEAYAPFYWEDADLGYRAWKRGWKSVYNPSGTVLHKHSATISALSKAYVNRVKARNQLLFMWRNISDSALVSAHRAWLPLVLARRALAGDFAFLNGWRDAYAARHDALAHKAKEDRLRVLSDREIMAEVGIGE